MQPTTPTQDLEVGEVFGLMICTSDRFEGIAEGQAIRYATIWGRQ